MFLQLAHTRLDVFNISRAFVLSCYKDTKLFPNEEKFALVQQIRRAAMSVHLNLAEGSSRKSMAERERFYEISRGSIVEIDTAFDIAVELEYINKDKLENTGSLLIRTFQMLSKMIGKTHVE
jgi:four helix bundle protein